ncbi:unnamed protein product [Allacma fusca]|uniref:Uncharacterized protein n=1 Tax=Allacma fusca TaxID=39272 RepID=A0A8J2NZ26_9HEXA|nr:unnamed protein product [Allacma fusca]
MEKILFTFWLLTLVTVNGHRTSLNLERSYKERDKEYSGLPVIEKYWGAYGYINELSQTDLLPSLSKREYYGLDTADYTESREGNGEGVKKPVAMKKLLPFTSMLQQLRSAVDTGLISQLADKY